MDSVHIIAEAGTNHNGQLIKAKNLAKIAKTAGADSVKFQIINTWGLYLPGQYKYGKYKIEDVIRIRLEGELDEKDYKDLNNHCKSLNIPFSASVFDEKGLDLICSFKPPYIKIASCDLNNLRFLRKVAEKQIKMILSTGMSTFSEIEQTVNDLAKHGFDDLVLMHCVSEYPAHLSRMNLSFLDELIKFGFPLGLSDHTNNSIAACMALTKGVKWFEKHFTEDISQEGLDHAYAMEKKGLEKYIGDIHDAEKALCLSKEKVNEGERLTAQRARRSLYAARDIHAGEIIRDDDILIVRPQGPMSADQYDLIVGKKINIGINKHQPFRKELFSL